MTLTVGGNDVIHVIKDNITNLNVDTFTKPAQAYQKRLRQIIELARKDNKNIANLYCWYLQSFLS